MNIALNGFRLIQEEDRFNIEMLKTVSRHKDKKATGEKYQKWVKKGYSLTLENAIKKVILLRLSEDIQTLTLSKFLEAYKKEKNEILKNLEHAST